MRHLLHLCLLLTTPLLLGCLEDPDRPLAQSGPAQEADAETPDDTAPTTPAESETQSTDSTQPELASAVEPMPVSPDDAQPSDVTASVDEPAPAEQPVDNPDTERVKAEAGVAKAGRSLDEYEGMYVTPAKALFSFREKAVFQIQIPKNLQLYKGINGHNPRTHEEFMKEIIEANLVKLPELPPGQRYVWDPEKGELMVERPR